jgi:hypothetical protein
LSSPGHSLELSTGHSCLKFRACFSIILSRIYVRCHYAQGRHYARGTGSCKLVRPCVVVICTGQWIHEFRLVTPSILCTGHSFLKFRAVFFVHCSGSTTVVIIHGADRETLCDHLCQSYAQGRGSRVPLGHSLYPMHRAQFS